MSSLDSDISRTLNIRYTITVLVIDIKFRSFECPTNEIADGIVSEFNRVYSAAFLWFPSYPFLGVDSLLGHLHFTDRTSSIHLHHPLTNHSIGWRLKFKVCPSQRTNVHPNSSCSLYFSKKNQKLFKWIKIQL